MSAFFTLDKEQRSLVYFDIIGDVRLFLDLSGLRVVQSEWGDESLSP